MITFFIVTFGSYRDTVGGWSNFFYRVVKLALYISGRTFSRKESFLSETFRYKNTLGSFGHLEYWEEKCLFFEKKIFLNTFFGLWEKLFRTFGSFLYAGLSHLHSACPGELLQWQIKILKLIKKMCRVERFRQKDIFQRNS